MNYYELFDIPVTLNPDKQLLKQRFYILSRKYHPDFFTQENENDQLEALEKSSQVNKAYKTFQQQDATIKYLLQLKGLLEEEEKYQLPPDFLMEMMDLNEQVDEAETSEHVNQVRNAVQQAERDIYAPVKQIIEAYNDAEIQTDSLLKIKEYYFKKKYLNRILEGIE